jgi:acyl-CoA reductase-like NAD-dependent aldehyde dehydrogenase
MISSAQEFCVVGCRGVDAFAVRCRSEFAPLMDTPSLRHLIGGDWSQTGETFESVSPHDGSVVAVAPTADQATVDRAVRAAAEALRSSPWGRMKAGERASALLSLADVLEAHEDELAQLVATEMGKPIFLARDDDVATAADRLRYFAGVARTLHGSVTGASPDYLLDYVAPRPVGPAALLMPWNDPIELALRKVGAALAAGCTVVMKSSELAPATLTRWVELVVEADILPAGVINLVHGPGDPTGDALVRHPGIAKVSFTGSTPTGTRVLEAAASTMKRVTLECGGKAPCIVFPDCDLDKAVDAVAYGAFLYAGQSCTAVTRLVVHESLQSEFVDRVARKVAEIPVGNPLDERTRIGPLVSQEHAVRVMGVIDRAKRESATVVIGGERDGAYVSPTIVTDVQRNSALAQEEVFGPVLAVMPFSSEDEALEIANEVEFGLAASVWSRDIDRTTRVAAALEFGDVWLNTHYVRQAETSFGGWKRSGLGRELGVEGVQEYLRWQRIALDRRPTFHVADALDVAPRQS